MVLTQFSLLPMAHMLEEEDEDGGRRVVTRPFGPLPPLFS
jgi:hypothetical protein